MNNLIAYIPVLNRQYREWLKGVAPFNLYLISQELAELFLPRLGRNVGAVPTKEMYEDLLGLLDRKFPGSMANIFDLDEHIPNLSNGDRRDWIMPDEDICHAIAKTYLRPAQCAVQFAPIWGRWDMTAVKREEPVIPDLEVSSRQIDVKRMEIAVKLGKQTPDWWRQIAAVAFHGDVLLAASYCAHHPTEYETAIFGDPRANFDAGDPAGAEVYLSLHAEKGIVGICAREGFKLKGASVYVTTFPCGDCARMLASCQIKELLFLEGYSVLKGLETLRAAGIRVVKVNSPELA